MTDLVLPPLAIDAGVGSSPLYTGEALRAAFAGMLTGTNANGVARTGALDQNALKVSVSGANVTAASGGYAVGTGAGAYVVGLTTPLGLGALAPADATNPRVDRVVLRIDDPSNGGNADRKGSVEIVKGTPSFNPALPAVVGTTTYADLARIDVPRSGGGNPAVTDLRVFTAAAGGVVPFANRTQLTAWAAPVGTVAYDIGAGLHYVRQKTAWVQMVTNSDTGWVAVPPGPGFELYNAARPILVRLLNGMLMVGGVVRPKAPGALGSMGPLFTLPAQFRSTFPQDIVTVQQASGVYRWAMTIRTSGEVTGERYGSSAEVEPTTSHWMPFSATWMK